MKKYKILMPILGISAVSMTAIPLTGCNKPVEQAKPIVFSSNNKFTFGLSTDGKQWNGDENCKLEISTDGSNFETWDGSNKTDVTKIYLRGTGIKSFSKYYETSNANTWKNTNFKFTCESNTEINCSGDIRALLNYSDLSKATMGENCFQNLFYWCSNLVTPPSLPATTLSKGCYSNMFNYCSLLKSAPRLPATTLAESCYSFMFKNCTQLITIPEDLLPATNLADNCYEDMFYDCSNLTTCVKLPATTLKPHCYASMFKECGNLKIKEEQSSTEQEKRIFTCPADIALGSVSDMFFNTTGSFTAGTPTHGNTYYWY